MDEAKKQSILKLEQGKFSIWLDEANGTRDEKLKANAAESFARSGGLSGGKLKRDIKITFEAINEVVTKVVVYRKQLAEKTPELAQTVHITPLRSRLADYIFGGVKSLEHYVKQTMPQFATSAQSAFSSKAQREAKRILDRVTTELDNMPLEMEFMPKEEPKITFTINGHGNNVNLGNVIGELKSSVQMLNQSSPAVGGAIVKLGKAIETSHSLDDAQKSDALERLTTVSEEIAKAADKRKRTNLIPALQALAALAQATEHLKPLVVGLLKLLGQHHGIDTQGIDVLV